jgi:pentatricopeptide repeat protein
MCASKVIPDNTTYTCVIEACGAVGSLVDGEQVHAHLVQQGVKPDLVLWGTLLGMYSKCGNDLQVIAVWNDILSSFTF